jgi:ER-bound oxygenase mpaB/B'/Rubber oxygenase, catalytic domain
VTTAPIEDPSEPRAGGEAGRAGHGPAGGGRALDDARLDALRAVGDPAADALAAGLLAGHEQLDERDLVRLVLGALVMGPPDELGALRAWMVEGPELPAWADPERVRAGQEFFACWALPICSLLYCASLPCAYAAADGVQVLALTSDLATNDLTRRIAETGQMVVDVMDLGTGSPDTLRPGGQGYVTVRGVRLLHAVVRQVIVTSPAVTHTCDERVPRRWCAEWGRPVNQEDLLGTLLTFTVSVLGGLDRLGVPYDRERAEDYLHTWCVAGALLGIDESVLPRGRDEAEAMATTIFRRHHRPSRAGRRLMAVLLGEMEQAMPWGLRRLPRTLVRHVVPPGVGDTLAVPAAAWWAPVLEWVRRAGPTLGRVPLTARVLRLPGELIGRAMIRLFVDRSLLGLQPPFRLDATAAAQLAVPTSARRQARRHRRYRARARRGVAA